MNLFTRNGSAREARRLESKAGFGAVCAANCRMQMKQNERYVCNQCGCEVTVTTAPSVAGKGGQGSLVCCGEKMSQTSAG